MEEGGKGDWGGGGGDKGMVGGGGKEGKRVGEGAGKKSGLRRKEWGQQ